MEPNDIVLQTSHLSITPENSDRNVSSKNDLHNAYNEEMEIELDNSRNLKKIVCFIIFFVIFQLLILMNLLKKIMNLLLQLVLLLYHVQGE